MFSFLTGKKDGKEFVDAGEAKGAEPTATLPPPSAVATDGPARAWDTGDDSPFSAAGGLEPGRAERAGAEAGGRGAADRPARSGRDCGVPAADHRRHQDRLRSGNSRRHLRARPDLRNHRGQREARPGQHDADESGVPVGAADSAGSPLQGESGPRHHRSLGGDRLGAAVEQGPDVRGRETDAGNVLNMTRLQCVNPSICTLDCLSQFSV